MRGTEVRSSSITVARRRRDGRVRDRMTRRDGGSAATTSLSRTAPFTSLTCHRERTAPGSPAKPSRERP